MAILRQALDKFEALNFHPTTARTATGSGTGVDLQQYDGDLVLLLDSAAGSGTTPTMTVTVEHSDSLGSGYSAISGAAFTQVTTTASQQKLVISKDESRRYVRVTYTIGGTSPSFTFSVNAVGVKKYG
ncbi:MAG: hypothetical protein EBS91_01685 [Betaproteobacteria bacterium]|jgi:hypothetical protein|nr:hypothetical protein [Betaproteobacteria bacterium]